MTSNFQLCRYQPALAAEIVGWVRTPKEAREWCGLDGDTLPLASMFEHWHQDPDIHPYLLKAHSLPVAYGELWVDLTANEIELARLIVRPNDRGQGVGRRLVEELVIVAATFGLDFAFVRVLPENEPALACYRSAGFLRVSESEEKQFNTGQPADYVWLRRRLSGRG